MNIDIVKLLTELKSYGVPVITEQDVERANYVDIGQYQMNTLDSLNEAYKKGKYEGDLEGLAYALLDVVDNPDYEPEIN